MKSKWKWKWRWRMSRKEAIRSSRWSAQIFPEIQSTRNIRSEKYEWERQFACAALCDKRQKRYRLMPLMSCKRFDNCLAKQVQFFFFLLLLYALLKRIAHFRFGVKMKITTTLSLVAAANLMTLLLRSSLFPKSFVFWLTQAEQTLVKIIKRKCF